MELWRLLAHRHWITLRVLGREVRLCARCSGYAIGFLILTVFQSLFGLPVFHSLSVYLQILLCLLTVAPLALDWLTQSWGWRESSNGLRLLTGAILGMGLSLFSQVGVSSSFKALCYTLTATVILAAGSAKELLLYRWHPKEF